MNMTIGYAVERKGVAIPRTQTLLRTRVSLAPAAAGDDPAFERARARLRAWLLARAPNGVKSVVDGGSGRHADVALSVRSSAGRYVFALEHADERVRSRAWTVEADLARTESGGALDLRVSVRQPANGPAAPLGPPAFLAGIAEEIGFFDVVPMRGRPVFTDASRAGDFMAFLRHPARTLPAVLVSAPAQIDPHAFASAYAGVAHVVVVGEVGSWAIADEFGPAWKVFGGAVRVMPPGVPHSVSDPRLEAPRWLRDRIEEIARGGTQFHQVLGRAVCAKTTALVEASAPRLLGVEDVDREVARERRRAESEPPPSGIQAELFAAPVQAIPPPDSGAPPAAEVPAADASDHEVESLISELDALRVENANLNEVSASYERWVDEQKDEIATLRAQLAAAGVGIPLRDEDASRSFAAIADGFSDLRSAFARLEERAEASDALYAEAQELREALDDAYAEREELLAWIARSGASAPAEDPASVPEAAEVGPAFGDGEAFEAWVAARYGGDVAVSPRARKGFKAGAFADLPRFYAMLDLVGREYVAMRRRAAGDEAPRIAFERRRDDLRVTYGPSATLQGARTLDGVHNLPWNGRSLRLEKVRTRSRAFDPRFMGCIYFAWDDQEGRVVLADLPRHLLTLNAPT